MVGKAHPRRARDLVRQRLFAGRILGTIELDDIPALPIGAADQFGAGSTLGALNLTGVGHLTFLALGARREGSLPACPIRTQLESTVRVRCREVAGVRRGTWKRLGREWRRQEESE